MSIVRRVPYFDIQDKDLPVVVSYVLWGYFYPVQNDACHTLTINDLEEQLPEDNDPTIDRHGGWQQCFNEHVNNPMSYVCLNPSSRAELMQREKKPTLREGFEEFKQWAAVHGIANNELFVVAMWW
jgi:hypothetical protein